jgi:Co/Zn/Cd efflux system component
MSAHVVVARECDRDVVRRRLEELLGERFGIHHTTLQVVRDAGKGELLQVEAPSAK